MRDAADSVTGELLPVKRGRGRPRTGQAMTAAERQAVRRSRSGLVVLSVELPPELVEALRECVETHPLFETQAEVVADALRAYLRSR